MRHHSARWRRAALVASLLAAAVPARWVSWALWGDRPDRAGQAGGRGSGRSTAARLPAAFCRPAGGRCGLPPRTALRSGAEGRSAAAAEAPGGLFDGLTRWWNETGEFIDALELFEEIDLNNETSSEAVVLRTQIALLEQFWAEVAAMKNETVAAQTRGRRPVYQNADRDLFGDLFKLLQPLPGMIAGFTWVRGLGILNKRRVKKGLSSAIIYVNIALAAVFFRVVAPRLLAAGTIDELFDAAGMMGIPDRASLLAGLDQLATYGDEVKIGLYILIFAVEKVTMLSEFLPIQIGLKTIAPVIFGGLVQGALASAACETAAATVNFGIGRTLLTQRLREFSIFGSQPMGEAAWFAALTRAASKDGLQLTLLLRLAPVLPLPFDSYWYILGALPVAVSDFALGHFVGCLKTAFLDASFGVLLLNAISPGSGDVQAGMQQVLVLETAAFAIVALLVSTVATRLINELLGLDEEEVASLVGGSQPSLTGSARASSDSPEQRAAREVD